MKIILTIKKTIIFGAHNPHFVLWENKMDTTKIRGSKTELILRAKFLQPMFYLATNLHRIGRVLEQCRFIIVRFDRCLCRFIKEVVHIM